MAESTWTSEFLDEMREVGYPPADAVVAEIFADGEVDEVNRLMKTLVRNDGVPTNKLPAVVRDYLAATDDLPPWADEERIREGERFFGVHGVGCVMALACASLPACYAARRGVQVLSLTARLESDPVRRIGETAQLTLDCMATGGLAPGSAGIRDAQKVRLMHAAVRHLVRESDVYDPEWGLPINQEDLAGTLLTFSVVVTDSLVKLGTTVSDDEADAYFHAWNCVGHVLGIDHRLMADRARRHPRGAHARLDIAARRAAAPPRPRVGLRQRRPPRRRLRVRALQPPAARGLQLDGARRRARAV